jgi:hypothetical protein
MALWILLGVAALTFSVLVGVMEGRRARRAQRRLLARTSIVLHPLPMHGYRRIPVPVAGRVFHYMGLFLGFLAGAYVVAILLRLLWRVLAYWFQGDP